MRGGIGAHEETVVVDVVCAAIDVREESNVLLVAVFLNVEEVARHEVESCCVKGNHVLEVSDAQAEVTQLHRLVMYEHGLGDVLCGRLPGREQSAESGGREACLTRS